MANAESTVLIVDDDVAVARVLGALLRQDGLETVLAQNAEEALRALERRPFDVIISDVRMPGLDGMQLLGRIVDRWPEIPVIMLTAFGTVELAVDAMKRGAADFVLKPFDREEITFVVRKALAGSERARTAAPQVGASRLLVGDSVGMAEVHATIARAAPTMATIVIRGESGTGKELVARSVHAQSRRADGPFVAVHCGALPDNLLESELFGYEKGAFTGAATRKPGRVELAAGGTLFLDEIGDTTPAVQVKLLRLLQERQFDPLGSTQTRQVDVRFVAATHRDLEGMVKAGSFREDLFYRLSVVPVWLPPLRDRPEDVEQLARHFCDEFGRLHGRPRIRLTDESLDALGAHRWPGNVRELRNLVERLVVLSDSDAIEEADVKRELAGRAPVASAPVEPSSSATLDSTRSSAEREALVSALDKAQNNRTLAARMLGVSRRTLYSKLHEHGLL